MNIRFNIIFTFLFVLMCFSCKTRSQVRNIAENNFSGLEIKKVLQIVEKNNRLDFSGRYYHLRQSKKYNDSTYAYNLIVNSKLPSKDDFLSDYIKYKDTFIFIYDSSTKISAEKSEYLTKNNLFSKSNESPLFFSDSKFMNLMVEKVNNEFIVNEMRLFLQKGEEIKEDETTDF
ncbi:hypothetical protein [Tenacibaculum sp. C7A-26P2]|uniref:hypothetical protein n=1 Tax=Tenacibaculum sp. C7A-26P2 TaxID=3447504 RepID=UPI003F8631E5